MNNKTKCYIYTRVSTAITLDKEDNTGDLVPLEKLMTLETSFLYGFLHY